MSRRKIVCDYKVLLLINYLFTVNRNQMNKSDTVLVLGAQVMVGSSLTRALNRLGNERVLAPSRRELDLLNQRQTLEYFEKHRPKYVFDAAAKVGGIIANNTQRADFIFQNLQIQNHIFEACFKYDCLKLLFLGSNCIYPKNSPQPMKEEHLLTGPLEPTNEPYAIAKIAGVKLAENFRRQYGKCFFSVMPTSLYGENDNYDPNQSHVIPGLIVRMENARISEDPVFSVWGTGKPRREFLYVDDLAQACIHLMNLPQDSVPDLINVGYGDDISIGDLVLLLKKIIGYEGEIHFDTSKPDGMMVKRLDSSRILSLGWKPQTGFEDGLRKAIEFYRNRQQK